MYTCDRGLFYPMDGGIFHIPSQTRLQRLLQMPWYIGLLPHSAAPLELHADQGRNFKSILFKEVCRFLQITKTRTTLYRPSSHGMVERFNRTLGKIITSFIEQKPQNWDLYLSILTAAYGCTVHPATGYTYVWT